MTQRKTVPGVIPQPIKQGAQRATRSPWFEGVARFGYAAKGVVYLVAGALSVAVLAAGLAAYGIYMLTAARYSRIATG